MVASLVERLHYRVNNPSAWPEGFDQGGSDLFAEAVAALRALEPQQEEAVTCKACDGSGSNPLLHEAALHPCKACRGTGYAHPTPVQKVQGSQTVSDEAVERFGQAFWGVNWHRGGFETIRVALTAALVQP